MDPLSDSDKPLREAEALMSKYRISGVPIVDENKRLVGIITNLGICVLKGP